MSTTVTIKNLVSTYVNASVPKGLWYKKSVLAVRNGDNNDCFIYIKGALPGPRGATYTNGKLRLYATAAIPSRTYRLRLLTSKFDVTKVHWDNKPSNTTTGQVEVTASVSKYGFIEFDVASLLNTASLMKEFFGFMIYIPDPNVENTARFFYSGKGPASYVPSLEVTYNTAPKRPVNMNPSGDRAVSVSHPVLTADFQDVAGNTEMNALQVQISTSATMSPIEWDSGSVTDILAPELRLADTSYPGVPGGARRYWRIRYQDGDGNWGPYSDVVPFRRTVKPTVTIVSPGAAPNDFVEDTSPTVIVSYSGSQKNIQVMLWNDEKTELLADTNKITTTDTGIQIPSYKLRDDDWYRLEVRVWDVEDRAQTPGDPAYSSATRRFQYRLTDTVTPTTNLMVTRWGTSPWAQLDFDCAATPDFFDIFRDGTAIAVDVEPEDLLVAPNKYRFIDRMSTPHTSQKWEARAKTNGRTSSGNSTRTATIKPTTAYLAALDGSFLIPFLNYSNSIGGEDGSTVVNIANSDTPIVVYQGVFGKQGGFSGVLSGELKGKNGTETARDHRNNLLALRDKKNQGKPCVLTYADNRIGCVVSQIQDPVPVIKKEEILYSCEFFVAEQKGFLQ